MKIIIEELTMSNKKHFLYYILEKYNIKVPYKLSIGLFGKPYFRFLDYSIGVSHSNEKLALAISKDNVGIDIEKIKPDSINDKLAEFVFSKNEYEKYYKLNNKDKIQYFYYIWTLKESFGKFFGTGLCYSFRNVDIEKLCNYLCEINLFSVISISNNEYILAVISIEDIDNMIFIYNEKEYDSKIFSDQKLFARKMVSKRFTLINVK